MDVNVKIEVTQEDINEGGHSCNRCPIHRAIARTLGIKDFVVSVRVVTFYEGINHVFDSFLPEDVHKRLMEYDFGDGRMQPFTFRLSLPLAA